MRHLQVGITLCSASTRRCTATQHPVPRIRFQVTGLRLAERSAAWKTKEASARRREAIGRSTTPCFRARREHLKTLQELWLSENHGQNAGLTVPCVPCSFDCGVKGAVLLDLQGAVLALVVRQGKKTTNLWHVRPRVGARERGPVGAPPGRDFFVNNLLVRIHLIIVMIRWTGLVSWEFEFPFPAPPPSTRRRPPAFVCRTGVPRS